MPYKFRKIAHDVEPWQHSGWTATGEGEQSADPWAEGGEYPWYDWAELEEQAPTCMLEDVADAQLPSMPEDMDLDVAMDDDDVVLDPDMEEPANKKPKTEG